MGVSLREEGRRGVARGALLLLPCRLQEGKRSPRLPLSGQHLPKVEGAARAAGTWAWPLTQLIKHFSRGSGPALWATTRASGRGLTEVRSTPLPGLGTARGVGPGDPAGGSPAKVPLLPSVQGTRPRRGSRSIFPSSLLVALSGSSLCGVTGAPVVPLYPAPLSDLCCLQAILHSVPEHHQILPILCTNDLDSILFSWDQVQGFP